MSCVRRRGARLAGALSLIALLLVPAALATHVHADPRAAPRRARCSPSPKAPSDPPPGSGGSVRRGSGEEDPMGYTSRPGLLVAAAVVAAVTAAPQRALGQEDVRRELEELKKQLRALKQQIERQQAIIEKLSAGQP